jgi:uncharacterized protein involved in outer membrane biogenesis
VAGWCGLGLACLVLAALAFLWIAPPLDAVRDRLAADVRARTGRTLSVSGPMSVSLFPRAVVAMGDVSLGPPEGVAGAPVLTVPSVHAEVDLWSLVSGRPRIGRVTLHRPLIELAAVVEGVQSRELAVPELPGRRPAPRKGTGDAALPRPQDGFAGIDGIKAITTTGKFRPWSLRIVGGTMRYHDGGASSLHEVGAIDVDVTAQGTDGHSAVNGSFAWRGVPLRFSGTAVPGPAPGRPGRVAFKLVGEPLDAAYEGTLGLGEGGLKADGVLSLQRLQYKHLPLGPASIAVTADAGSATLTLRDMQLEGGRAEGSLTVDATGQAPALAMRLKLTDVAVLPLLKAAAGAVWLDGRGSVALDLKGEGSSQREIAASLQGQVQVAVADGTVAGIDLDRSLRALQRGRLGSVAPRRKDRTPFSALNATFQVADGIAANDDLKLVGERVELTGAGRIELVPGRIDYTLQTKVLGGPADEKAIVTLGTVEIPIAITGQLDRPEFAIKDQDGVGDALQRIGKNLKSRDVQDAIQGLLGGDNGKRVSPGELIEKLLKHE